MGDGRSVAITGATGFVGSHLTARFLKAGWTVRVLARNLERLDPELVSSISVVEGELANHEALGRLIAGSSRIVHAAGVVTALDPALYTHVNVDGTRNIVSALRDRLKSEPADQPLFIHLSSLAARYPDRSLYAASKAEGEEIVRKELPGRSIIIRPPAVYGPRDVATLPIFEQLAKGILVAPRSHEARFSMIHVADLANLIEHLASQGSPSDLVIEPDDGRERGYSWPELARAASSGLQRNIHLVSLPRPVFSGLAYLSQVISRLTGKRPLVTHDKIGELFEKDWVATPSMNPFAEAPAMAAETGLAETMRWYRQAGWL